MADAQNNFQFVEDPDQETFFLILPDGTETDESADDEIAICDDGIRTYIATNCDEFPGVKPGVVYALGEAMPTTVVDIDDIDDLDEDDDGTAPETEETEVDAGPGVGEEDEDEDADAEVVE